MTEGLRTQRCDGALVAHLHGEIDLENALRLQDAILESIGDAGADAVIIDLAGVTYFDSSGMRMLDAVAGTCDSADLRLRVVAPDPGPARFVLRIVAWPEHLLSEGLDSALAELSRN